jgi:hypothetical protein
MQATLLFVNAIRCRFTFSLIVAPVSSVGFLAQSILEMTEGIADYSKWSADLPKV